MFTPILQAIAAHDVIIIHRHVNPDGDALGSQIGLKHIILENFPHKQVYMVGDEARRYSFMEDSVMDTIDDEVFSGALSIILDTSAKSLISDSRYTLAACTVRMDHHLFCEMIAQIEVTDSTFESCCGLVTQFAMDCSLRLTPLAAKSLYTGMVTDSGRFRYDSTTSRTFRLASFLMEQPFDASSIYASLYASDFALVRLRAQFIMKIRFTPKNVAYIYTPRSELKSYNADFFTISRGMVGTMSDIQGVDIWANFTESTGGIVCELRSNKYNINPIAVKYGGGGHAKASGATLKNYSEVTAMLRDLDDMIGAAT